MPAEYHIASPRCLPDCERSGGEVEQFTRIGDYRFGHIADDIIREPHNLMHRLPPMAGIADDAIRQADLRDRLRICRDRALGAIDLLPIEWTARLHEAQTPFSVYLGSVDE